MLTFVPTPIGNLGDITLRAIETLREADLIACEDTRHSLKLLNHLEIAKPLTALHDHNEDRRIPELLEKAAAGEKIAVISDAGNPCLSDPGHRLLKAARDTEVPFTVLPGPSAITTALVASGFPPHPFSFHGFLPVKKGKRGKQLKAALDSPDTTLFFESPHRLPSTLEILAELSPETRIGIARELTKTFETLHHGTCAELNAHFSGRKAKGEIVLLIPPVSLRMRAHLREWSPQNHQALKERHKPDAPSKRSLGTPPPRPSSTAPNATHTTKRNFEIFKAPDFIAAALLHFPPKGQQTVRYYGLYSNNRAAKPLPSPLTLSFNHVIGKLCQRSMKKQLEKF